MSDFDLNSILSLESKKSSKDNNSSNSVISSFSQNSSILNKFQHRKSISIHHSSSILSSSDLNASGGFKQIKETKSSFLSADIQKFINTSGISGINQSATSSMRSFSHLPLPKENAISMQSKLSEDKFSDDFADDLLSTIPYAESTLKKERKKKELKKQKTKQIIADKEDDMKEKNSSDDSKKYVDIDGINISSVLSLSSSNDKDSEIPESFPSLGEIVASYNDNVQLNSSGGSSHSFKPKIKSQNNLQKEGKKESKNSDDNFSDILSNSIPNHVINPMTSSSSSLGSNDEHNLLKSNIIIKDEMNDIISATFSQHSLLLKSQTNQSGSEELGSDSDRLSDIISNFSNINPEQNHDISEKQSDSDNPSDIISAYISEQQSLNKFESKSNSNKITDAYSDIISGSISNASNKSNVSEKGDIHLKPSSLDSADGLMSGIMSSDIAASSSHSSKKNNTKKSDNGLVDQKISPSEKVKMKQNTSTISSNGLSGIMSSSSIGTQKSTKYEENKNNRVSKRVDKQSDILSISSIASISNELKSSKNDNNDLASNDPNPEYNHHNKSSHSKSSNSSHSSSRSNISGIFSSSSHKSHHRSKASKKSVHDSSSSSNNSRGDVEFSTTEEKTNHDKVNSTFEIEGEEFDRQNPKSSLIDSRRLSIGSIASLSTIDNYKITEDDDLGEFTKEEKSSMDFLDQIISDIDSEKSDPDKVPTQIPKKDNTLNSRKTNKLSQNNLEKINLKKLNNADSTNFANSKEIMPGIFFGGNSNNSNNSNLSSKSKILSDKKDSSSSIVIEYESGSNSFSAAKKTKNHSVHSSSQNVKSLDSGIFVEYESYSSNKSKRGNSILSTSRKSNSTYIEESSSIADFISEDQSNTKSKIIDTSSAIIVDFESNSSHRLDSSHSKTSRSNSTPDNSSNIVVNYDHESSLNIETFDSQIVEDFDSTHHKDKEYSNSDEYASGSSGSPQSIYSMGQIESDFDIDEENQSKFINSESKIIPKESASFIESFSSSKSNLFEDDFEDDTSKTKHNITITTGIDDDDFIDSNEVKENVEKVETESDNIISSVQSFHSSSSIKRKRKKQKKQKKTPEESLKMERPYAMTIHGKHENKIQYTHHNKINFSLPPAKKGKATIEGRKPIVLFEPPVLSSATLSDVNSCYRESLRGTQKQLRYINQSLSSMLLSRRERDTNINGSIITLDGVYQEINKRNIERRELLSQDHNLEHYSSATEL